MALPSIEGYLLGTRKPIDYVGTALSAFETVNSQLLATRAQNQSEQESNQKMGNNVKEGMQDDRMFEEDIIDKRLDREIAQDDQSLKHQEMGMKQQEMGLKFAKFGMEQDQYQWEQQNLRPLELESMQLDNAGKRQKIDAMRETMSADLALNNDATANLNVYDGYFTGTTPVPKEAMYDDEPQGMGLARVLHNQIGFLERIAPSLKNPGLNMQIENRKRGLANDPIYQQMIAEGKTMLPMERAQRNKQRASQIRLALPFQSDAETDKYVLENEKTFDMLGDLDDKAFNSTLPIIARRAAEFAKPKTSGVKGTVPATVAKDYFDRLSVDPSDPAIQFYRQQYPSLGQPASGGNPYDSYFQPR